MLVRSRRARAIVVAVLIPGLLAVTTPAVANPGGGTVASGRATIDQSNARVTAISQVTDRAILNWQSFSNRAGETIKFTQPSTRSVALNRVVGADPSVIAGQLQSNGRVFLTNPNGVVFTSTSRVDVGGIIATTLSIKDEDFLKGRFALAQDPSKPLGAVVNRGAIRTSAGGYVALVAPLVHNDGTIDVPQGKVGLAAGTKVLVDPDGSQLIQVEMKTTAPGAVTVNAAGDSPALRSAVMDSRVVDAGAVHVNGDVVTLSNAEGLAVNSGSIHADGAPGARAGSVVVQSVHSTLMAPGSVITANGQGTRSNGGEVLVLSHGKTSVTQKASLAARGGASGDGGTVEVSGEVVRVRGDVDVGAREGKGGKYLIDPVTLTIVFNGCGNLDCSLVTKCGTINCCNSACATASLSATALRAFNSAHTPGTTISLSARCCIIVVDSGTACGQTIRLQDKTGLSLSARNVQFQNRNDQIQTTSACLVIRGFNVVDVGRLSNQDGNVFICAGNTLAFNSISATHSTNCAPALVSLSFGSLLTVGSILNAKSVNLTTVCGAIVQRPCGSGIHADALGIVSSPRHISATVGTSQAPLKTSVGILGLPSTGGSVFIEQKGTLTLKCGDIGVSCSPADFNLTVRCGNLLLDRTVAAVNRFPRFRASGNIFIHVPDGDIQNINCAPNSDVKLCATCIDLSAKGSLGTFASPLSLAACTVNAVSTGGVCDPAGNIALAPIAPTTLGLVSTLKGKIQVRACAFCSGSDVNVGAVLAGCTVDIRNSSGSLLRGTATSSACLGASLGLTPAELANVDSNLTKARGANVFVGAAGANALISTATLGTQGAHLVVQTPLTQSALGVFTTVGPGGVFVDFPFALPPPPPPVVAPQADAPIPAPAAAGASDSFAAQLAGTTCPGLTPDQQLQSAQAQSSALALLDPNHASMFSADQLAGAPPSDPVQAPAALGAYADVFRALDSQVPSDKPMVWGMATAVLDALSAVKDAEATGDPAAVAIAQQVAQLVYREMNHAVYDGSGGFIDDYLGRAAADAQNLPPFDESVAGTPNAPWIAIGALSLIQQAAESLVPPQGPGALMESSNADALNSLAGTHMVDATDPVGLPQTPPPPIPPPVFYPATAEAITVDSRPGADYDARYGIVRETIAVDPPPEPPPPPPPERSGLERLWDSVSGGAQGVERAVGGAVQGVEQAAVNTATAVGNGFTAAGQFVAGAAVNVANAITGALGFIGREIGGATDAAKNAIGGMVANAVKAGQPFLVIPGNMLSRNFAPGNRIAYGPTVVLVDSDGTAHALPAGDVLARTPDGVAFFNAATNRLDSSVFSAEASHIVAAGGGNIVAAGGGNIVSAGGGNIVSAGGGNIIAAGGGNIVAAGGGNIVAAGGGNIVAAGAGNIVAARAGTLLATGAGGIVSAGGGNILKNSSPLLSQDGSGIVAAGGGNAVARGGGNLLIGGGASIVSAGGGN